MLLSSSSSFTTLLLVNSYSEGMPGCSQRSISVLEWQDSRKPVSTYGLPAQIKPGTSELRNKKI